MKTMKWNGKLFISNDDKEENGAYFIFMPTRTVKTVVKGNKKYLVYDKIAANKDAILFS